MEDAIVVESWSRTIDFVFAGLAVAFAACCVWLGVRAFNRRERWAKRTFWALVAVPLLYFLSLGPLLRLSFSMQPEGWRFVLTQSSW